MLRRTSSHCSKHQSIRVVSECNRVFAWSTHRRIQCLLVSFWEPMYHSGLDNGCLTFGRFDRWFFCRLPDRRNSVGSLILSSRRPIREFIPCAPLLPILRHGLSCLVEPILVISELQDHFARKP